MSEPTLDVSTSEAAPSNEASVPEAKGGEQSDFSKITSDPKFQDWLNKQYKVRHKVNGQETEFTMDELKRFAGLGKAGHENLRKAAEERKAAEALLAEWKSGDVVNTLRKLGKSDAEIREYFEKTTWDMLQEDSLTPEQKKLREYEEKLAKIQQKEREEQEKLQQEQYEKEVAKYRYQYETEIAQSIAESSLPKHEFVIRLVANELASAIENDIMLSTEDAVKFVEERFWKDYPEVLVQLDDDKLEKILGPTLLKRLRAKSVAEAKKSNAPFTKPGSGVVEQVLKKSEPETRKLNLEELNRKRLFG